VVFLSFSELTVLDINAVPQTAPRTWQMYGHDHQRTGCADCPEDVLTAVGPDIDTDADAVTRVSFAAPYPNPIAGSATSFSFAVPVRAQVRLEIYDLRGQRVRSVVKEELGAGSHVVSWDGRGGEGQLLASGQYFARLTVRGPGVHEQLTRKITLLR
jgi:hypothetical protein